MAKITLDEEFVDETTKIVDVGFCLSFRLPESARREEEE